MNTKNSYFYNLQFSFFIFLILGSLLLLFFVFRPFLSVLVFAVTLAVIFYPIHKKILHKLSGRKILAALLSMIIVFVLILIPLIFVSLSLFQEVASLYASILNQSQISQNISQFILGLEDSVSTRWPGLPVDISQYLSVQEYLEQGLSWILENLVFIFSGFVKWALGLFLMILALFYFFKDGPKLRETFMSLSPLSPEYSDKVLGKIGTALNSVIMGRLLVGIIQGIVTALGFFIFSIPNPILWGTVAAVFSVLPVLGPLFIIIPAALYAYFIMGSLISTVGLIIWGVVAVLLIDEYLGSIFIDRGLKIHPFLILLSILGGLGFFGPIGFILGPVSLSLFFALLEIYPMIVKT